MPRKRQGPKIETRLLELDHRRFQRLVAERETTMAQLGRDAILFYLDHVAANDISERESMLEKRIIAMDDRLSRLIALAAVDLGVLINLEYQQMSPETRDEDFKAADYKAKERLKRKLSLSLAEIFGSSK